MSEQSVETDYTNDDLHQRYPDPRPDHGLFKRIDRLHGLRCRGRVIHCADGILCLLCGKEWDCACTPPVIESPCWACDLPHSNPGQLCETCLDKQEDR